MIRRLTRGGFKSCRAGGSTATTEVLWLNPAAAAAVDRTRTQRVLPLKGAIAS